MSTSEQHLVFAKQGETFIHSEDYKSAISALQKAVNLKPDFYQGWISLSKAQFNKGDHSEAMKSLEEAEKHDPLKEDFQRIQQAMQGRAYPTAANIAQNMLKQYPGHPRAIFTKAHLFAMQGAHEDRAALLVEGLEHSPANLILRKMLISAYEDCGDFEKAISTAHGLVEIEESFDNLWTLMSTLLRHSFNENILELAKKTYSLCGNNQAKRSEVDLLRGQALKILGRRDDSVRALKSCIENKPQSGTAWWALADMKDYRFSDTDKKKMQGVIADQTISPDQRSQATFALAKAFELEGDLNRAMECYIKANAFRGSGAFDGQHYAKAIETIIDAFTPDVLSTQSHIYEEQVTPIFIVGMPRSGSTLIEQILASHSQIEGTIELLVLPSVKRKAHLECVKRFDGQYLEKLGQLQSVDLQRLGRSYFEGSAIFRKEGKPYFIDKLPYNFEHIGLIHKILPHALIIDARRNPMDCGYSLFKQYFSAGANFSYDLSNIGTYYNGYLKIMDHWEDVLPGKVLHVQYEDLVRDTEKQILTILDYIGLGFETTCLKFYENKRAVRTASSEQVRQPIYTQSIGAWRSVKTQLEPLKQSLGPITLNRFETDLAI